MDVAIYISLSHTIDKLNSRFVKLISVVWPPQIFRKIFSKIFRNLHGSSSVIIVQDKLNLFIQTMRKLKFVKRSWNHFGRREKNTFFQIWSSNILFFPKFEVDSDLLKDYGLKMNHLKSISLSVKTMTS